MFFNNLRLTFSRTTKFLNFVYAESKTLNKSVHCFKFSNMSTIKIGTHNGCFHCDEVLACYMLKLLPEYKDAQIIR